MLDIQLLRNNIDAVAQRLATRGYALDTATFQRLETERKTLQTRTQDLQASRNSLSKQIGMLKGKGEDASAVMAEVAALKSELEANEVRLGELLKEFDAFVATIPNVPQESVPVGKSEADNVEVHRWGTPRSFDFPVKDHVDLGESLGQLDFATAAKIAGQSILAVMANKELVNAAFETTLAQGVVFERRLFHSLFAFEDQKEGMAAFVEKRKPAFTGR